MPPVEQFEKVARLPMRGDNCAIATRRLERGSRLRLNGSEITLDYAILEGHRFALKPIRTDEHLISWGLPFGVTTRDIAPGNYVCNESMLETLRSREPSLELPKQPNFRDEIHPYVLDETQFRPAQQVPLYEQSATFLGYPRGGKRGVGTRNYVVILGTTSRTSSYARLLAHRLKSSVKELAHIDGVVAVSHTEGGGWERPNNREFLLRALAGFLVHPNVGAVLAADFGSEPVNNRLLLSFMEEYRYPLSDVLHQFFTLKGGLEQCLATGEQVIRGWLPRVNQFQRVAAPASELKVALQCGGSDAFSGISANPLIASVAREIIRYGGCANLAETDELIGAESYILKTAPDLETARRFLAAVERFKERVSWHGQTAEGNPSGGNRYRGLYNIALKSIGAALKKHPDVSLDQVIEYGERMTRPGFYFMDSPGNDLESVAGQVAAGANLIFFTTGNGSITNFPFVPTIKVMCTTRRYQLLSEEMDVNAGAYLDGAPMEELTSRTLDLTFRVASGEQTRGEKAGHAQVSIWRDWRQTDGSRLEHALAMPEPSGQPLPIRKREGTVEARRWSFPVYATARGYALDRVGLILPTSLCAAEIARLAAQRLNDREFGRQHLSRLVALPHTEGCGVSGAITEQMYTRTQIGYLTHPSVRFAVLMEHGCEKTHNDYMRHRLHEFDLNPEEFGWVSVQLDGGISRVLQKVEEWFSGVIDQAELPKKRTVGSEGLRLGLMASQTLSGEAAEALVEVTRVITESGGSIVVPENSEILQSETYVERILDSYSPEPSLAYGQKAERPGFHIMQAPTRHWVETLTGLGATGVGIVLGWVREPMQGHPLVPVLQTAAEAELHARKEDLDLLLTGPAAVWPDLLLDLLSRTASCPLLPKCSQLGNVDFQFSRGLLGVSM